MSGNKKTTFLDLEITNRCRLACEKCIRTELGKSMKIKDMSIEDFTKIAESGLYHGIFFGGTYGDCIYHPKFLEIIKIAKKNNIKCTIHTNGSGKKLEWWRELFSILDPKADHLNVAMDGYKETSGIYRVNFKEKDFDANIEMMSIAIKEYKIKVVWTFIPMKFNEHQIQQAAELAIKNDIIFAIKKSNRWSKMSDPRLPSNLKLISPHSNIFNKL